MRFNLNVNEWIAAGESAPEYRVYRFKDDCTGKVYEFENKSAAVAGIATVDTELFGNWSPAPVDEDSFTDWAVLEYVIDGLLAQVRNW